MLLVSHAVLWTNYNEENHKKGNKLKRTHDLKDNEDTDKHIDFKHDLSYKNKVKAFRDKDVFKKYDTKLSKTSHHAEDVISKDFEDKKVKLEETHCNITDTNTKREHNDILTSNDDETVSNDMYKYRNGTNNSITTENNNVIKTIGQRNGTEEGNTNSLKKSKKLKDPWRLNSRILVTLVILNVTGQGIAVEVISSSTLASLLGYPSTCTLGSEERPCTLSISCWLRGGTRLRGCGGWLFSCCQPPDNTWDSFDNNIPSSDWKYKVSPPRLRQVPQRNVMPNNVFRRRVDEDVTPQFDCGLPASRILQKRIIGGREARFAEFPWQAHVRISEFQCGGVLVSRWFVATAAHCVSRAPIRDISVWLGALDTSAGSHTARKVGVIKKILHPLFQFRMTQPDRYDIALLKLSRPITFTRHIRAICLPESEMELRGRSAVIAGWGKTDATDTHTGTNMLRSATVPILSKEQCITWHRIKQISVEIHSEMICAGHSDGHQDACLGDSGGPLIVLDSGRYYLVGITSAGFGCGVDHQPGIYHNVQVTADWIRGVMAPRDNYIED